MYRFEPSTGAIVAQALRSDCWCSGHQMHPVLRQEFGSLASSATSLLHAEQFLIMLCGTITDFAPSPTGSHESRIPGRAV
jgi:hypothetical protein